MKILIFTENYHAGGMDTFIITLINNWPMADEFFLVCNQDHPGIEIIEKRLRRPCKIIKHDVIGLKQLSDKFSKPAAIKILYKILMLFGRYMLLIRDMFYFLACLKKLSPERVIVVGGNYPGGNFCRAAALSGLFNPRWGKPVFIYHNDPMKVRGILFIFEFFIDFVTEKSISYLVTVSHNTQNLLSNRPGIAFTKKKKVIYNGIEPRTVINKTGKNIRDELGIDKNIPVLLMLGTYEKRKGHEFLLQSLVKIKESVPKTQLIIAGYGYPDDRRYVELLVEKYNLSTSVHLLDFQDDILGLLAQSQILVVPSQKNESFGLTAVEAMAQKVPVAVTRVGGLSEVVADGEGGYSAKSDDVNGYASLIVKLLENESLRKEQGEKGYQRYQRNFTAERMAWDYAELVYVHIPESKLFFNWVRKKHYFIQVFSFLFKSFFLKAGRKYIKTAFYYYPDEIKKLSASVKNQENQKWILKGEISFVKDNVFDERLEIILAGKTMCLFTDKNINWHEKFEDPEDEESLHRWNWMVTLLSQGKYHSENLAGWVSLELERWFDLFLPEIKEKRTFYKNLLRWESYTVGERIANTILFYCLIDIVPTEKISAGINKLVGFLISNLEYRGRNTGNHIFNNARAVYLAGAAFDIMQWRNLATAIIRRELPVLVSEDGFLREGSSHYQFLFTRWVWEINYFAQLIKDNDLLDYLAPFIKVLLKQCRFFLVYDEGLRIWDIPRFGDISPDFSPQWLLDWTMVKSPELFLRQSLPQEERPFSRQFLRGTEAVEDKLIRRGEPLTAYFPKSGWYRTDFGDFILFFRFDEFGAPIYAGHHHNDMFSFCLFYKGSPILVDSGRLNYNKDAWGIFGLQPSTHNTFTIDGNGAAADCWRRYPAEYFQCKNYVESKNLNDGIKIVLHSTAFERLLSSVKVTRAFSLFKRNFIIEDNFQGSGRHFVQTYFHWGPGVALISDNSSGWKMRAKSGTLNFSLEADSAYRLNMFYGGKDPQGWVCRQYGHKVPGRVFEVQTIAQLPLTARYVLRWED